MSELVDWINARLDEDEATAERLRRPNSNDPWGWQPNAHPLTTCGHGATQVHVNPARVLAEVNAKRAILALHRPSTDHGERYEPYCVGCWEAGGEDGAPSYPCPTVRLLASVWVDAPGFREEWRP